MTKTIEQKALKFIDENHLIEKDDKVLVALSGGADSIFLLSFLIKFKKRFTINVAAFHLNHKLRGKSADADEKFCTDFCQKNKTKLISVSKDVKSYARKNKISAEEAGRIIRYRELNKAAKKLGCNKIATAHNSSDNVETILLNLFKGSGLKGLSGIPASRENIIRPVLCLGADEIRKYLNQNKISFRLDESNLYSDYERNYLRNEIIPKLKRKLNPRVEEKVNNTSKIISEIDSYIEKQIELVKRKAVRYDGKKVIVELRKIKTLYRSFLNIFLKSIIENYFNIEITSANIYSLIDLIGSQKGKSTQLKKDIVAFRERNELVITERIPLRRKKTGYKIKIGQKLSVDRKIISVSAFKGKLFKLTKNKSMEFISGDELKNIFLIRKWKAGDRFQPIGMKGTKKISDFLSDEKISSLNKNEEMVLTNSGKIVWVIGHRIDDRFKVTPDTKKILQLTVTDK